MNQAAPANDKASRSFSALGKLFRTTTFKLTLVYLTVFALFAVVLANIAAVFLIRIIGKNLD